MRGELAARSYLNREKKKLLTWAIFGCFVMIMSFCALINSYMGPLSLVNFQITSLNRKEYLIINSSNVTRDDTSESPPGICNYSLPRSDFCEINGEVRIHGNSSSIYITPSILNNVEETTKNSTWKLRPYARKTDRTVMKKGKELSLGSPSSFGLDKMPKCSINHTVPAVVFSAGGYIGNIFHEFSDLLVPLYITSKPFDGAVQFLATGLKPGWPNKYKAIFSSLSKYDIIDMDNSNDVHCFPSSILGLKNPIDFGIDPSMTPQGYSMKSFTQFVRSSYSLTRNMVEASRKPRLLILSRKGRRVLLNEDEVAKEAKRLGYEAVIMEASWNVKDFSKMVNSFDVMIGVHGAGLTNMVFLPEKAVLIQVVPMGLEWVARNCYGLPAVTMDLRYLEYKISRNESSLTDDNFIEDPVNGKNSKMLKPLHWDEFKVVYLDGQNVTIDVERFRPTLLKALEFLQK